MCFFPLAGFLPHSFSRLARYLKKKGKENEGQKEGVIAPGHQVPEIEQVFPVNKSLTGLGWGLNICINGLQCGGDTKI